MLGHASRGMFLYNLLQAAALSLLFSTIICSMDRYGIPKQVALLGTFFYASPIIAFFAITMIKDTLFSLFFVLYYLTYLEFSLLGKSAGQPTGKQWCRLILLSVLIALMNKKGMFLALGSNMFLFFHLKGKEKSS